jgi:hypothetical protein
MPNRCTTTPFREGMSTVAYLLELVANMFRRRRVEALP